nr:MFS transporter [Chryseolinea sp.]
CLVMVLCAFAYGAVFTIIPDFGQFVGIKNKGLLFTYLTLATLVVRLIGGKASDRWGRRSVLIVSSTLITVALLIIGSSTTQAQLIIGVALYGFAQGATSPTLLAWATDLSDPHHKGRGVASLYIFMEMGIGLGALLSGFVYSNNSENFFITFLICSLLSGSAFLYLIFSRKPVKSLV